MINNQMTRGKLKLLVTKLIIITHCILVSNDIVMADTFQVRLYTTHILLEKISQG
jgi:hypothetical protein